MPSLTIFAVMFSAESTALIANLPVVTILASAELTTVKLSPKPPIPITLDISVAGSPPIPLASIFELLLIVTPSAITSMKFKNVVVSVVWVSSTSIVILLTSSVSVVESPASENNDVF